jgi:hypothetical protein
MLRFRGTDVTLGGETYTIPPLTLAALEVLGPKFEALMGLREAGRMQDLFRPESIATIAELAHACLVRNYPDMTLQDVKELIDLASLPDVFGAIVAQSVPKDEPHPAPPRVSGSRGAKSGRT